MRITFCFSLYDYVFFLRKNAGNTRTQPMEDKSRQFLGVAMDSRDGNFVVSIYMKSISFIVVLSNVVSNWIAVVIVFFSSLSVPKALLTFLYAYLWLPFLQSTIGLCPQIRRREQRRKFEESIWSMLSHQRQGLSRQFHHLRAVLW